MYSKRPESVRSTSSITCCRAHLIRKLVRDFLHVPHYPFHSRCIRICTEAWQLYTADNFYYLNQSQCYTVDGMNDAEDYGHVRVRICILMLSAKAVRLVFVVAERLF